MLALDPRVVEAVWHAVEPWLPRHTPKPHPLGCHRPRIPDRACLVGILIRLVTGCSWDVAGRLSHTSESTLRRRRDEWVAANVFGLLVEEALAAYDRVIGLDVTDLAIDGSQQKAPFGGEGTGPSVVDRRKQGWKWSIATGRDGIPVAWTICGAHGTTASCSNPPSTFSKGAVCSMMSSASTSIAVTTTPSLSKRAKHGVSSTRSRVVARPAKAATSSDCRLACAGQSNAPTAGSPTTGNSAATPTAPACIASLSSNSQSRSSSRSSSSNGPTGGNPPNGARPMRADPLQTRADAETCTSATAAQYAPPPWMKTRLTFMMTAPCSLSPICELTSPQPPMAMLPSSRVRRMFSPTARLSSSS
jgi:transposase